MLDFLFDFKMLHYKLGQIASISSSITYKYNSHYYQTLKSDTWSHIDMKMTSSREAQTSESVGYPNKKVYKMSMAETLLTSRIQEVRGKVKELKTQKERGVYFSALFVLLDEKNTYSNQQIRSLRQCSFIQSFIFCCFIPAS